MSAAGYVRGGVNTEEAAEFWTQFKDLCDCGKVPFVLAADWNATPDEVKTKGWCAEVDGILSSTGLLTCAAREVDFLMISFLSSFFPFSF